MSPLLIGPDEGEWAHPLLPEVLLPVEGSQVSILKRGLANGLLLSFWVLAFGFGWHAQEWLFYFTS